MPNRLNILAENRDDILLAEIGAMIHNIGKMSTEHLIDQNFNLHLYFGDWLFDLLNANSGLQNNKNWQGHWNQAQSAQGKFYPQSLKTILANLQVSFSTPPLNDRRYELREFSSLRKRELYDGRLDNLLGGKTSLLGKLLSEAHGRAVGGDKGFTLETNVNQQERNFIHLSSAFGYEKENISQRNINIEKDCFLHNLQILLKRLTDTESKDLAFWTTFRLEFHQTLKKHLSAYIADTRYPINDVDLYSFHHSTASFFKAGIAKILLEQPTELKYEDIENFEWKLLSVRYSGLDYLMQARGVSDILGKQQALRTTLNVVKELLEIEYPIANEVYRDENGSVFLLPSLAKDEQDILNVVKDIFREKLHRDLKPDFYLSPSSRQALILGEVISNHTPKFNQFYPDLDPGQSDHVDLCQSCNLRFIGSDNSLPDSQKLSDIEKDKALSRKLCGVCYRRREKRAKNWWEQENDKTIWMDEVADDHGQLALIAGKFDLKNWLNGWWLNSFLGKSFREVIEKRPSLLTDYKNELKKDITNWINRIFQPHATQQLRQEISNTINSIGNVIHSLTVDNIKEVYDNINEKVETLRETFILSGISITDIEQCSSLFGFLKDKISSPFPNSVAPYLNFDPAIAFSNLNDLDIYIKNERDAWGIYQANNDNRFFFVNAKTASFARLSRIWQQTREFNQNIPSLLETCLSVIKQHRLIIKAKDKSQVKSKEISFKTTHVYEFKRGIVSFSFYCIKGSESGNRNLEFVSATNWDYLQREFQFHWQKELTRGTVLKETTEKRLNLQIEIESVKRDNKPYYPYVTILAEPQLFLLLVPAAQAVNIVSIVKRQYDEQFSKVRNRLPLNMAVVFAKRKQPLYTILEAGRKMLDGFDNKPLSWEVQDNVFFKNGSKEADLHLQAKRHENETITSKLNWQVSTRLGDPAKTDFYYPYFFTDYSEEKQVGNRTDIFKAPLSKEDVTNPKWRYACHVSQLKKGDRVYITPSFFDFEFLEVPGRRFDLYYDKNIRALRKTKPFLLDDLCKLEKAWKLVANGGLTNAQFRGLLEVIESKRESWLREIYPDEAFKKFVEHTIHTQAKQWYQNLKDEEKPLIREFAQNGRLLDVFELYMKILKRRLKED